MTSFVILARRDSSPNCWTEEKIQDAHSAEAAVKAVYLKHPDGAIVAMVAVPVRSWRPTPIRLEKVERVVLGEEPQLKLAEKPEPAA